MRSRACLGVACGLIGLLAPSSALGSTQIGVDRQWSELPDPGVVGAEETLAVAARKLGSWQINLGGVRFDGSTLERVVTRSREEPLLRALREQLRLPIDQHDFLLFLDDLLSAGAAGLRGHEVWVSSSGGRRVGILLHPDDVFHADRPRAYATGQNRLEIERPPPLPKLVAAQDGALLGPGWVLRFANPSGWNSKLAALTRARSDTQLATRIKSLLTQCRAQGAYVSLTSTVRDPRRGYLMWGAYILSRATTQEQLDRRVDALEEANAAWDLDVPIRWRHPAGWRETLEAARSMAAVYRVVFATKKAAKGSSHYSGRAVDLVVRALPRSLRLTAPDGQTQRFDLSDPEESRDLSLTPRLVEWVEEHFGLQKLRDDYPHWNDGRESDTQTVAMTP